jgi:hypothetical protein
VERFIRYLATQRGWRVRFTTAADLCCCWRRHNARAG